MNRLRWTQILGIALVAWTASQVSADEEQDLIATLQSAADVPQKCAACQKLRVVGTERSVPALADLLSQDRTGHAARYALEALPCPAAGTALREAAGRTTGSIQAGLIDSLGWRRDAQAVPMLAQWLSAADPMIASAAAAALGRIGNQSSVAALSAARGGSSSAVRAAVLESLLQCAEQMLAAKDTAGAAALYRSLGSEDLTPQFRVAVWRGLALSDSGQRIGLLTKALTGDDRNLRTAAVQLVRELGDPQVIEACRRQWAALDAEAQLAVLDSHLKQGVAALPTVQAATESSHPSVRVAAWQALGGLDAPMLIPALARAAASGESAERVAARETLARMSGPAVGQALIEELGKAESAAKAELLGVLGERGEAGAVNVLLQYAGSNDASVRLAALDSLRELAAEDSIIPLLELVGRSNPETDLEPLQKALSAACQTNANKEAITQRVVRLLAAGPPAQRRSMVALLSALATPEAMQAALAAARDDDAELAKNAVRTLADWPTVAPAEELLELAGGDVEPSLHALAMRAAVQVIGRESDAEKRIAWLRRTLTAAKRPDERRLALGQLGQIHTPVALEAVLPYLADPGVVNEAATAAVGIAEQLADADPQRADAVAAKILELGLGAPIANRALALRGKPKSGPFLRDWLVCGPYSQANVAGAEALFEIAFGPEKSDEKVSWQPAPEGDMINLSGIYPDKSSCVAYLQTQVIAPQECEAQLLLGSDDGVKAWLNGSVVHGNNIDRGAVVDQDRAVIQLKAGPNRLLLKITQGGGGWSACARVVDMHGMPIPGLRCER